ncbi:hypothetical protein [Pseudomonas fluorescens]|uniref:Uncharacterized protein n=1 Tax=Pseudomonas fluorescens TaxID=294 RepID=A0A423MEC1_PSEFL|nr:hypothetical protein [Pseudomonas fluorescens]RON81631.1 hypothetical protein BK670_15810 [Pseudomonas fluorescens]
MVGAVEEINKDKAKHEKPLICVFDVDPSVTDALIEKRYDVVSASLGKPIRVGNRNRGDAKHVKLNFSLPENLHEYDVVVIDLGGEIKETQYTSAPLGNATGGVAYAFYSAYPESLFNPRPGGMHIVGGELDLLLRKLSIVVIFSSTIEEANYQTVKIDRGGSSWDESYSCSTRNLYAGFPSCSNKVGRRIKSPEVENVYFSLVKKYFGSSQYQVVFEHPTYWDSDQFASVQNEDFVPLVLNDSDEIISYFHAVGEGAVFVFPQVEDKAGFIKDLFEHCLAEHFPQVFPFSGQFAWLDSGNFPVPGEIELQAHRVKLEEVYRSQVAKAENDLVALKEEYKFLRDLISETGDSLVCAVQHYFRWLGFDSVLNQDEEAEGVLEEDLQIDCGDKLLVVEVKGIGGTSTDKACSQITKIKNRRMKQRKSFDVYGLYIVNHERYVAPDNRKNPPFTEHQLQDALLDERGLLTTYQLYLAFFLIRDEILRKEDVREQLFAFGLINLIPSDMKSLGQPSEYLMNGAVVVVDLDGGGVKVGDTVIAKKDMHYSKHIIQSLQVDGVEAEQVSDGVVGIKSATKFPKKAEIFIYSE